MAKTRKEIREATGISEAYFRKLEGQGLIREAVGEGPRGALIYPDETVEDVLRVLRVKQGSDGFQGIHKLADVASVVSPTSDDAEATSVLTAVEYIQNPTEGKADAARQSALDVLQWIEGEMQGSQELADRGSEGIGLYFNSALRWVHKDEFYEDPETYSEVWEAGKTWRDAVNDDLVAKSGLPRGFVNLITPNDHATIAQLQNLPALRKSLESASVSQLETAAIIAHQQFVPSAVRGPWQRWLVLLWIMQISALVNSIVLQTSWEEDIGRKLPDVGSVMEFYAQGFKLYGEELQEVLNDKPTADWLMEPLKIGNVDLLWERAQELARRHLDQE